MEDSMHNSEHSRSQRGKFFYFKKFLKILLVIIPIFYPLLVHMWVTWAIRITKQI